MLKTQFRSPLVFPCYLHDHLTPNELIALREHAAVNGVNISSISTVKVETIDHPDGELVHVKFAVRMTNKDSFTVSLGTLPKSMESDAVAFLNNERLSLIRKTVEPLPFTVVFCRGGLV